MTLEETLQLKQSEHAAFTSLPAAGWEYLRRRRDELTLQLVKVNNENTRGRLWELEDLINLPGRLQEEIRQYQQPPQQESSLL